MAERQISLIDTTVQTMMSALADSAVLSFLGLFAIGFAVWIIIEKNRAPKFDPLKHLERRPTIEHQQPIRALPPAEAYKDLSREEDQRKDKVPWR